MILRLKNLSKLIIFTACCALFSCSLINDQETQYIIVKQTYGSGNPKMINAAILITDKDEIKRTRETILPISYRDFVFPCGYDYDFLFWKNTDSLTHLVQVNKGCEEIIANNNELNEIIARYANQLRTAPTYFIYNLELPASMDPEDVIEQLKESGLLLFFIEDPSMRYSKISFNYIESNNISINAPDSIKLNNEKFLLKSAELKIRNIIDKVNKIQSIVYDSIQYYASPISYNAVCEIVNLSFKNGSDLSKEIELIKNEGGKQIHEFNPSVYYIQLLDKSNNIEEIKSKIKGYKFIKKVYLYPRTIDNPDYDGSLPGVPPPALEKEK